MSASISYEPLIVPLNVVTDKPIRETLTSDTNVVGSDILSFSPVLKRKSFFKMDNLLSSSKIFIITFSYSGIEYHTKVLKVIYREKESIYKVVLSSSLTNIWMCWLRRQPQGWEIVFGQELDEELKQSITSAIDREE